MCRSGLEIHSWCEIVRGLSTAACGKQAPHRAFADCGGSEKGNSINDLLQRVGNYVSSYLGNELRVHLFAL